MNLMGMEWGYIEKVGGQRGRRKEAGWNFLEVYFINDLIIHTHTHTHTILIKNIVSI